MIKPKNLEKVKTIGIVSPASSASKEKILKGKKNLEKLGFKVVLGKNTFNNIAYLSGSDQQRAKEINEMFKDEKIDAIMCSRGGYGTPRILDLLDYKIIKENPKIFIGFSDITAILNSIYKKTSLVTFHGPMLASTFSKKLDEFTLKSFKEILSVKSSKLINNPKNEKIEFINKGNVQGEIVGGNLALITSLMGTPYEIDTKDKILFIEEIGEKPYKIDRMLTQLKLGNKFKDAKGIILGQFTNCNDKQDTFSLEEIFNQIIKPSNKPIVKNLYSGHCNPLITLPIGASVEINTLRKEIKILESVVK